MSYSRWGNSTWYTFWMVQNPRTENGDTAIFCICGVCTFTAKELRNNMRKCIDTLRDKNKEYTVEELNELKVYIFRFLNDVNNDYPK